VELTRRDAAAALAALGAGGAVALAAREYERGEGRRDGGSGDADGDLPDDATVRETMVAVAEVVYPSEVEGVATFVEAFVDGRLDRGGGGSGDGPGSGSGDGSGGGSGDGSGDGAVDGGHGEGVRRAVADLNELARAWYDAPVRELPVDDRESLLDEVGADTAEEDPTGTAAERIRYYVVNELLLGLYTSPTGGELVGIENPQGHPGGLGSYQRGPNG
jgi:hypothetical protein